MDSYTKSTYDYLTKKYNRTVIGKKELVAEMGISLSTLDLYISRGIGVPRYKKLGNRSNSRVVFNIVDVAEFLNAEKIETM